MNLYLMSAAAWPKALPARLRRLDFGASADRDEPQFRLRILALMLWTTR